jgi:hypothetical protein
MIIIMIFKHILAPFGASPTNGDLLLMSDLATELEIPMLF